MNHDSIDVLRRGKALACCGLLLLVWFDVVHSQAYHFSKGWMPGRKRSPQPPPSYSEEQAASEQDIVSEEASANYLHGLYCQVRPQARKVLSNVIKAELKRLESECDGTKFASVSSSDLTHSSRKWNSLSSDE